MHFATLFFYIRNALVLFKFALGYRHWALSRPVVPRHEIRIFLVDEYELHYETIAAGLPLYIYIYKFIIYIYIYIISSWKNVFHKGFTQKHRELLVRKILGKKRCI